MSRSVQLRHYFSAIRRRLPPLGEARRVTLWAGRTFDDFVVLDGERRKLLAMIAGQASRLLKMAHLLDRNADSESEFARTLLDVCSGIDSGNVRLAGSKLRSYEDISIQIATLRRLTDFLSAEVGLAGGSMILTALILEQVPDSRPALLVRAELLMEQSQLDEAISLIQRALRIQAVCPSAQQLLGRALRARRASRADNGELDG